MGFGFSTFLTGVGYDALNAVISLFDILTVGFTRDTPCPFYTYSPKYAKSLKPPLSLYHPFDHKLRPHSETHRLAPCQNTTESSTDL